MKPSRLKSAAFIVTEPKKIGLTVALAAHAAVLSAFLLTSHRSSPELVPIFVEIITQSKSLDSRPLVPQAVAASRFITPNDKSGPAVNRSRSTQPTVRTPVVASGLDEAGPLNETLTHAWLRNNRDTGSYPKRSNLNFSSDPPARPALAGVFEQQHPDPSALTVTNRTDWQDNPVEDKVLKYSAPGGAVRLTVREASSAGLALGLVSGALPTTTAKSRKVDFNVVDLRDFGLTVFSYQNEVGSGFKSFGETKKEFVTPGTRTTKAGGQVRVGAVSFGFAHSRIANVMDSSANFFTASESNANYFAPQQSNAVAAQNEASVTLALSKLLPGIESNLLPNLWASVSNKQALHVGPENIAPANRTVTTSFGGTWNWNSGSATLGYWNYSSGNNPGLGATWGGRGFDANLGAYHSSFGIDVGLSYGQSENAVVSWQSTGALYASYVTVSYKPDRLPAISVTAATGNYNYNAITYGVAPSDLYVDSSRSAYSSLALGLNISDWLWSNQGSLTGPYPSLKLLYRYTKNAFYDSSASMVKDPNSLVAMMMQGKF